MTHFMSTEVNLCPIVQAKFFVVINNAYLTFIHIIGWSELINVLLEILQIIIQHNHVMPGVLKTDKVGFSYFLLFNSIYWTPSLIPHITLFLHNLHLHMIITMVNKIYEIVSQNLLWQLLTEPPKGRGYFQLTCLHQLNLSTFQVHLIIIYSVKYLA